MFWYKIPGNGRLEQGVFQKTGGRPCPDDEFIGLWPGEEMIEKMFIG